jgi:hypothetical protein
LKERLVVKERLITQMEIAIKEALSKTKEMDTVFIGINKVMNIMKAIGPKIQETANLLKEKLMKAKLFWVNSQMDREKENLSMLIRIIIRAGLKIGKMV